MQEDRERIESADAGTETPAEDGRLPVVEAFSLVARARRLGAEARRHAEQASVYAARARESLGHEPEAHGAPEERREVA